MYLSPGAPIYCQFMSRQTTFPVFQCFGASFLFLTSVFSRSSCFFSSYFGSLCLCWIFLILSLTFQTTSEFFFFFSIRLLCLPHLLLCSKPPDFSCFGPRSWQWSTLNSDAFTYWWATLSCFHMIRNVLFAYWEVEPAVAEEMCSAGVHHHFLSFCKINQIFYRTKSWVWLLISLVVVPLCT